MKRQIYLSLVFVLLVLLAACSAQTPTDPLVGSEWSLLQINGRNLAPGTHVEINFEPGTFSGFGGCNSYGGRYQLAGSGFTVLEGIESTAMFCETPEGMMDQESEYFSALTAAAAYQVVGGRLELTSEDGVLLLVFTHQQEAADFDPESLAGTGWQVVSMAGQALIEGSQITLIFDGGGRVHGFAGCRNYAAEYIQTEDGTRFTTTQMIEEVCSTESLLVQEGTFTDYFTWTERFELVGDTLILHAQNGKQVVFDPLE